MDCKKSNYLDVYFSRISHLGSNTSEIIQNSGIRAFDKWLSESPHAVDLSVERGLYFSGIILSDKDKEERKIMTLNVANDIPIVVGDIVNWKDGKEVEKWILFRKERKVNGTYQTFSMIRCNYIIKWIDKEGHVQQSWSYFVSSLDSKVKENFRTWNALITPQPNKHAEIILPRKEIERGTTFIVEDEAWNMVEYDYSSVPGIMYISVTEEKVNSVYDDLKNNIADTDKIARYKIITPEEKQSFSIGSPINLIYSMNKNGKPYNGECNLISQNKKIAKIIDGKLTAVAAGEVDILVQFKAVPEIKKMVSIIIGQEEKNYYYLEGSDTIKLDRLSSYRLSGSTEVFENVEYYIKENSSLASILKIEDGICVVKANKKNKLGTVILAAKYQDKEYFKEIKIIPLW